MTAGFPVDWLQLRAPFDSAARRPDLERRFVARLPACARLIDLGAGSGANLSHLAPRLGPGRRHWTLIDHDVALLAAAEARAATLAAAADVAPTVVVQCCDLARDLDAVDFAAADGVVATAFLDLVSAKWIARLAALVVRHRLPVLFTQTVDGRVAWRPADADDALVQHRFAAHQRTDKGFGPALGGRAVAVLAEKLTGAGYTVETGEADWRIGTADRAMLDALIGFHGAAAMESADMGVGAGGMSGAETAAAERIRGWMTRRRRAAAAGILSCRIGHRDLTAWP